jgi:sn-glycerol 3-phosphate transport system substrate-binding protein
MKKLLVLASLLVSFASAQPMELSFQHSMNGPLGEAVTAMVEKYNSSQEEIVIREVFAGTYDEGLQKILAQLAAGDSPDIAQLEVALVARVAESGQLLDLAPRLQGENSALYEDLWPVFREQIEREDGAIYALPFNNSNPVLYYNPELLEEAGVEPPKTYAEFPEIARRINEATGASAVAFEAFPWVLEGTVWSNGGEVIEDGALALNQPNAAEAVQTWTEMIQENTATVVRSLDEAQQNFATGNLAMMFGSVATYFFLEEGVDFDFGVAPLPYFDEPVVPVGGAALVIFNGIPEERQEAAWDFLTWLTEPEQQFDWVRMTNYVPVRQSATELPAFQEYLSEHPDRRVGIEQLPYARPRPSLPGYPEATPEIIEALESIWLQDAPLQETLDDLVARTERLFR